MKYKKTFKATENQEINKVNTNGSILLVTASILFIVIALFNFEMIKWHFKILIKVMEFPRPEYIEVYVILFFRCLNYLIIMIAALYGIFVFRNKYKAKACIKFGVLILILHILLLIHINEEMGFSFDNPHIIYIGSVFIVTGLYMFAARMISND